MFCGLLFLIMKLCEPMVIFTPHGMLINKFTICHLSLDFLYCSANHTAKKQLACNYCLFVDMIIIMRCRAGKKKLKSSGPVHFSLKLPPLKYYLPNRCTMFMPYQPLHLLGTACLWIQNYSRLSTHCCAHLAYHFSIESTFTCPLDHQSSIFTYSRAKVTCPGQSDLGFFLSCLLANS